MDEADMAAEIAEMQLAKSLSNLPKGPKFEPKGSCHNCETEFAIDDPLRDKKIYCDSDCEQDHHDFLKRR